jgi:hypothetical protein
MLKVFKSFLLVFDAKYERNLEKSNKKMSKNKIKSTTLTLEEVY